MLKMSVFKKRDSIEHILLSGLFPNFMPVDIAFRQRFASECHNMVPLAKPRPTRQSQEAVSSLLVIMSLIFWL